MVGFGASVLEGVLTNICYTVDVGTMGTKVLAAVGAFTIGSIDPNLPLVLLSILAILKNEAVYGFNWTLGWCRLSK